MEKKPPKKSGLTPEYDSQREQNVLLEKIYSEVKTVAEGHGGLVQNINDIKATLDEHGTRFDRIEMVVSENRKDIKELKTDVSQLKGGVSQLKVGQERIEQKLELVH